MFGRQWHKGGHAGPPLQKMVAPASRLCFNGGNQTYFISNRWCMEPKETKAFYVFYSWHSDLPDYTNRRLIRDALRIASSNVEEIYRENKLHIIIDEATTRQPGSPNIPQTILSKIGNCDVFMCDITTINQETAEGIRKVPNPNVIFELGYAVSIIGWDRIIMLFNKAFGTFPEDVPFDIDRQRISPYTYQPYAEGEKPTSRDITSKKKPLIDLLTKSISEIIQENPIKPLDENKSEKEIMRSIDITNLKWLLSGIHLTTIDEHIREAPDRIYDRIFYFWNHFNAVASSSYFFLYDKELKDLIDQMKLAWGESLSYPDRYYAIPHSDKLCFVRPVDRPLTDDEKRDYELISNVIHKLDDILQLFLSYIRHNYIEIDIDELSATAWKNYIENREQWL